MTMTDSNVIRYPEDEEWTEEEIEKLVENTEKEYDVATGGDGGDEQPPVHPGAVMAGIVLFVLIVYSLYAGEIRFASLNSILLVVLALGSKAMN